MRRNRLRKFAVLLATLSAGTLGLFGCTTATAFRDFYQTTLIRVFWQTVGTAIQSAIVDQFGAQDQG
jgi:hypothetical protein